MGVVCGFKNRQKLALSTPPILVPPTHAWAWEIPDNYATLVARQLRTRRLRGRKEDPRMRLRFWHLESPKNASLRLYGGSKFAYERCCGIILKSVGGAGGPKVGSPTRGTLENPGKIVGGASEPSHASQR